VITAAKLLKYSNPCKKVIFLRLHSGLHNHVFINEAGMAFVYALLKRLFDRKGCGG